MKKLIISICCILPLIAQQDIIIDPDLSPYSGSSAFLYGQSAIIELKDRYSQDTQNANSKRAFVKRLIGQLIVWDTLGVLSSVAQHEIFGHGYRLRELGYDPLEYQVTPWGGYTQFSVPESFTVGENLAVTVAGLEAEAILANKAKMNWMRSGIIDGRKTALYLQAQQSVFWYTWITDLGRLKGEEAADGNDVSNYISLLNASYGTDINSGDLMKWVAFNWLDPMTFYCYFAKLKYICTGQTLEFPTIPLGDSVRYLPNARIGYAPYGVEAYFENFFAINGEPLYAYVKGGKRSFGMGFAFDRILASKRGEVGLHVDAWRQNRFISDKTIGDLDDGLSVRSPKLDEKIWGLSGSVVGRLNLSKDLSLYAEVGGKSDGYLPGYPLSKSFVGRVGLTFKTLP